MYMYTLVLRPLLICKVSGNTKLSSNYTMTPLAHYIVDDNLFTEYIHYSLNEPSTVDS